jgi:hypothetical protein
MRAYDRPKGAAITALLQRRVNRWLRYRGVGRWADDAYGERAYLVLSLVATSVLAWQIFARSLAN